MFDVGFWELGLISVVALLVIGPERLPGVARTAGKWIGSARRLVSNVQADINAEVSKADKLKQLIEEQANLQSAHEILETPVSEEKSRKPVPSAKPDYLVKAVPNELTDENTVSPSEESSKEQASREQGSEQKT